MKNWWKSSTCVATVVLSVLCVMTTHSSESDLENKSGADPASILTPAIDFEILDPMSIRTKPRSGRGFFRPKIQEVSKEAVVAAARRLQEQNEHLKSELEATTDCEQIREKAEELELEARELRDKANQIETMRQVTQEAERKAELIQQDFNAAQAQLSILQEKLQNTSLREENTERLESELKELQKNAEIEKEKLLQAEELVRDCSNTRKQLQELQQNIREGHDRQKNLSETNKELEEKAEELDKKVRELSKKLKDCENVQRDKPFRSSLTNVQWTIKQAAFITTKEQLNILANLSPYAAPTVAGVPLGNARQVSEAIGHGVCTVYANNMDFKDLRCKKNLAEIGTASSKALVREFGWSVLQRIGNKTGINQKVRSAYQSSSLSEFLERHATTKEAVETLSVYAAGATRLGADFILENYIFSKMSQFSKGSKSTS